MQPEQFNRRSSSLIWPIARKELTLFFASPIAWLFLASFAAVELFVFFWGEAFFARNIADVRPLFSWMPLLLLFLTSALTMKVWSEERRSGTLESVLTQGLPVWHFVLGKFLGCFILLVLALLVTVPLPLTVSLLADLDWGPVLAGYLASVLLGSCYLAIGLYISARSDNQIVSLLLSIALCGVLYLIGHPNITALFGQPVAGYLSLLGTGSRFDAITRGMLDFRDLYYYLALLLTFLALNTYVLEKERFASRVSQSARQWQAITALLVANLLLVNLWLGQLTQLRYDSTAGKQYSLSAATGQQLQQLSEPLLIRGYFSAQTHPLLAPLVPQLQDLLKEYQIAGGQKVRVEWLDPASSPEAEQEANQRFNIKPLPFQVADRYQSSIVSSYFHLLIQYGSEYQVLGFRDLIEVKSHGETDVEVVLRNPELDITKTVKKVQQSYQAGHDLFATVSEPVSLKLYLSADAKLPDELQQFASQMQSSAEQLVQTADGKFSTERLDPDADQALKTRLEQDFGFHPVKLDPFAQQEFWFIVQLQQGDRQLALVLDDFSTEGFERQLKAGISRLAGNVMKTVALVSPASASGDYGGNDFNELSALLSDNAVVEQENLADGKVSAKADVLVLMAPENLSQTEVFAVDQFLMQGGTVVAATSPFKASLTGGNLNVRPYQSGLTDWLKHFGVGQTAQMVLDPQHAALPVPVTRQVGGFSFQEMRLLGYPWFADIRQQGMSDSPLFSQLPQVVVPWASPLDIQQKDQLEATVLLNSSEGSWLSEETAVVPRLDAQGKASYPSGDSVGAQPLAVALQGAFTSWFADKAAPFSTISTDTGSSASPEQPIDEATAPATPPPVVLQQARQGARLIVFSSNDMFSDTITQLVAGTQGSAYLNNLQLLANTVDWAIADPALLQIRGRGQFNRTLPPLAQSEQQFWEYLNYAFAFGLIVLIALAQRLLQRRRLYRLQQLLMADAR